MLGMNKAFLIIVAFVAFSGSNLIIAQTQTQNSSQELLKLQEAEVERLTASTEQLRPLLEDGLIAKNEFEKAENELADARSKVEDTRLALANAEKLAVEQKKAAAMAKTKSLVKTTSMSLGRGPVVMRSTSGSWSLSNLSSVQQFFSKTFGKPLPISTIGQSATHNRMGWNHGNSVDVGVHPDSAEGRALMAHLQSSGIPFLAFRAAVPGVSTGPHIHIGAPSHRL